MKKLKEKNKKNLNQNVIPDQIGNLEEHKSFFYPEPVSGSPERPLVGVAFGSGFKDYGFRNKFGMTGYSEHGRSFVEMLGVLAIMGIISIGGLYGYTNAMERHRANELINEANKRAMMVTTQLMTGKELPETPDGTILGDFTDPTGMSFKVGKNLVNDKQFKMQIDGVSLDVCEQMQSMMGGAVRGIECVDEKAVLIFNNDLSNKDIAPSAISTADGWTGNKPGSDCTDDTKLGGDSGCQVCVGSSYVDSDAMCETNQICLDGICITPTDSGLGGCTRNSDCTGTIDGIDCDTKTCYCNYYDYSIYHMRSGSCTGGPNKGSGVCMEATYQTTTATADGIAGKLSTQYMDWFSAKNFCSAVGGSMVSLTGSLCTSSVTSYNNCDWATLKKEGSKLASTFWWTKNLSPSDSCDVFYVQTANSFFFDTPRDNYYFALCE